MNDGFEIGLGTNVIGSFSEHHLSQFTSIDVAVCRDHAIAKSFMDSLTNLWTFQHCVSNGITIHDNEIFLLGKSLCEKTFARANSSDNTDYRNMVASWHEAKTSLQLMNTGNRWQD